MVRTRIALDDAEFVLAQGQDVAALRKRVEEAVHAGGGFVEFPAVGDRSVSVLITATSRVVISVETADLEADDTEDEALRYGGDYDLF